MASHIYDPEPYAAVKLFDLVDIGFRRQTPTLWIVTSPLPLHFSGVQVKNNNNRRRNLLVSFVDKKLKMI